MKTAKHPYVAVRCPYTYQTLFVKEHQLKTGEWVWLFKGKTYSNLDDILDTRVKKLKK